MSDLATTRPPRVAGKRISQSRLHRTPRSLAEAPISAGSVLFMALWFGLGTGVMELALIFLRKHFVDAATLGALQLTRHALSMVPASNMMILGTFGLVAGLAVRLRL